MSIRAAAPTLLRAIPLKFVHDQVAGGGRKRVDTTIALIPFIDFLITLVVFLLSTFSSSDLQTNREGLVLPEAQHVDELELLPIVAVDREMVLLDNRRVADARALASNAQLERIEQLVTELESIRRNWPMLHPNEPFEGAVILQADSNVDFRVVKKVMFSAAQAGYTDISFAVNQTGGD